jgi:hypothetical protein
MSPNIFLGEIGGEMSQVTDGLPVLRAGNTIASLAPKSVDFAGLGPTPPAIESQSADVQKVVFEGDEPKMVRDDSASIKVDEIGKLLEPVGIEFVRVELQKLRNRVSDLEARIEDYNVRASHRI